MPKSPAKPTRPTLDDLLLTFDRSSVEVQAEFALKRCAKTVHVVQKVYGPCDDVRVSPLRIFHGGENRMTIDVDRDDLDLNTMPLSFLRLFEFEFWPDALILVRSIVEAALLHGQKPALLLDERKITLRLRWPDADEDLERAISFTEEVDLLSADLTSGKHADGS